MLTYREKTSDIGESVRTPPSSNSSSMYQSTLSGANSSEMVEKSDSDSNENTAAHQVSDGHYDSDGDDSSVASSDDGWGLMSMDSADEGDVNGGSHVQLIGSSDEEVDLGAIINEVIDGDSSSNAAKNGREGGILILSGSEVSQSTGRIIESQERMSRTATALSVPGTDSIPSDMDSLEISNGDINNDDSVSDESHVDSGSESSFSAAHISRKRATAHGSERWRESPKSARYAHTFVTVFLMSTSFLISLFLAWDRYAWRQSALRLEVELVRIKADTNKTGSSGRSELSHPDADPKTKKENFVEELVKDENDHRDPYIFESQEAPGFQAFIVGNCWLQAKASFALGSCSNEVARNVKKRSSYVGEGVHFFLDNVKSAAKETMDVAVATSSHLKTIIGTTAATAPLSAGLTMDSLTSLMISSVSSAGEILIETLVDAGYMMEESLLVVLNLTRDAIEDATIVTREPRRHKKSSDSGDDGTSCHGYTFFRDIAKFARQTAHDVKAVTSTSVKSFLREFSESFQEATSGMDFEYQENTAEQDVNDEIPDVIQDAASGIDFEYEEKPPEIPSEQAAKDKIQKVLQTAGDDITSVLVKTSKKLDRMEEGLSDVLYGAYLSIQGTGLFSPFRGGHQRRSKTEERISNDNTKTKQNH